MYISIKKLRYFIRNKTDSKIGKIERK